MRDSRAGPAKTAFCHGRVRDSEWIVADAMMGEILTERNLRSQFATIEAGCSSRKPELEVGLGEGARAG